MQRSLVSFEDPFGFTLQLSQTIDPRTQVAPMLEAKKAMAGNTAGTGAFGGIDHISTYCNDFTANRTLYRDILGLAEFFYSTTREEGVEVGTGFEQGRSRLEVRTSNWHRTTSGNTSRAGPCLDWYFKPNVSDVCTRPCRTRATHSKNRLKPKRQTISGDPVWCLIVRTACNCRSWRDAAASY